MAEKRRPFLLVETKTSDPRVDPALKKFQTQLQVPAVQLTQEGEGYRKFKNGDQTILVVPAHLWLPRLP
ncbi:MAG: hypothetical protein AB1486_01260 [Planctomycetota bacterium]